MLAMKATRARSEVVLKTAFPFYLASFCAGSVWPLSMWKDKKWPNGHNSLLIPYFPAWFPLQRAHSLELEPLVLVQQADPLSLPRQFVILPRRLSRLEQPLLSQLQQLQQVQPEARTRTMDGLRRRRPNTTMVCRPTVTPSFRRV